MNETNAKDGNIRITENDLPQEFILKLLGQYEARGLWGIKHTREPVDVMVRYAKSRELSLPIVQLVITKEGIFMSPIQCRLESNIKETPSLRKVESRTNSDWRFVNCKNRPNETWNEFDGGCETRSKSYNTGQNLAKFVKENYADCENKKAGTCNQSSGGKFGCYGNKTSEKKKTSEVSTDLQLLERYSRFDWRKIGIFFFGIDTISYGVQDLIFTRVFSMIVITDRKNNGFRGNSPFMCHAFVCESRSTARRVTYALAAAFQAYARSMKNIRGPEKNVKVSRDEKPKKFTIELRPPCEVGINDSEA